MNVFVVYCHPCEDSFTYQVKESFLKGLTDACHTCEISDLYEMRFNPVMSEKEYRREAFYNEMLPVPHDVLMEQKKINRADAIAFIYPDFWTASPAMLEGWFQRVLTYGFAYGASPKMKILEKAVFLVTMGGSLTDEIRRVQLDAMKTVMIGDRMHHRAKACQFYVFDEMTRGYANDDRRKENISTFTQAAYHIGKEIS